MTKLLTRGSLALLAALTLAGCATNKESGCCDDAATDKAAAATATPAARVTTVNTVCPLTGEDFGTKDRAATTVSNYKGENVGFCCPGCVKKFDKMSEEKKSATLVAAKANKAI